MNRLHAVFAIAALGVLLACGGSSKSSTSAPAGPVAATSLAYTDPSAAAGDWKLVKDAASTSTHLVLDLVGPTDDTKYRGVGFTLQVDTAKVRIARLTSPKGTPQYFLDAGVFLDKNAAGDDIAPNLSVGGVRDGKLMVGIYQKTDDGVWGTHLGATAKVCGKVVLKIALDLDESLGAETGPVSLSVLKTRVIPEAVETYANRRSQDASLKIGTLTLD